MGDTFSVGRIAGIRVGVNWSWLVVFALITWTLAAAVFPSTNPGLGTGAYVAMAVVAALVFFLSLLLHEFGHALQARQEQVEIDGITLWLFGGVARFKGDMPSAGAEFRIAVAGPLVSLALAVLFGTVAVSLPLPEAVDGVVAWLGYTNAVLLLFNLLPALPLDGGRVLRSLLWMRSGDLTGATTTATVVARALSYGLIGGGIALFVLQGAFTGAWFAFIGWFLLQAATAESRWVVARQALAGVRVGDLMTRDPVTVSSHLPLGRLVDEVIGNRTYTTYPVVDDGRPVGLVPFSRVAGVPRADWDERTVRDCMVPLERVPLLEEDEEAAQALAEIQQSGVNRGLVLADGKLAGILSISDIADALELYRLRRGL
jgi:Zn-dependent protease/CBS domain-containing protein